jgi:hypothetical protein
MGLAVDETHPLPNLALEAEENGAGVAHLATSFDPQKGLKNHRIVLPGEHQ